MTSSLNIIISGGGTGGHIYPAVSIAKAILEQYPNANILFIGSNGRMEMEKVPAAGFEIKGIDIIGLQRKWTLKNLLLPYYILKSIQQVKNIFQSFQPNAVIGTGGYVSFPVLFTAQMQRIPTYIQEQNAYAGLANKILSKKAKKIFVAFDQMEKFFPKDKIILSGNPVRNDLLSIHQLKDTALQFFHLQNLLPVVLVLGGSLGARSINNAIANNIDFFLNTPIQLIWQMGKNYYTNLSTELSNKLQSSKIYYKDFIYEMNLAYAAADIIISRAGASTIAELAIVGKPAILVPSPNVTDDHQTKNALALVNKNAALMIKDDQVSSILIKEIEQLLNNKPLQNTLSQNIKSFAKPNAAKEIASTILNDLGK
jgi:UDP-N-acetylglucosamine--N-acetylmuramyl-(pentapeptide) pyrophosphoryl-undecaprenol N-acetylglucosamine transferase